MLFFWICSKNFMPKYFIIRIALFILFINIIVFGILPMVSSFSIKKSRFLNLVLNIGLTIYIRFDQSSSCLYIRNGGENFNKT